MNHNQDETQLITETINSLVLQAISGLFLNLTRSNNREIKLPEKDFEFIKKVADVTAIQVLLQCKDQGANVAEVDDEEDEATDIEFECPQYIVAYISTILMASHDNHRTQGHSLDIIERLILAWQPFAWAVVDKASGSREKSEEYLKERDEFIASWKGEES